MKGLETKNKKVRFGYKNSFLKPQSFNRWSMNEFIKKNREIEKHRQTN